MAQMVAAAPQMVMPQMMAAPQYIQPQMIMPQMMPQMMMPQMMAAPAPAVSSAPNIYISTPQTIGGAARKGGSGKKIIIIAALAIGGAVLAWFLLTNKKVDPDAVGLAGVATQSGMMQLSAKDGDTVVAKCKDNRHPEFDQIKYGANDKFVTNVAAVNKFCGNSVNCSLADYSKILGDPIPGVVKTFTGSYSCPLIKT